jgi:hypothetical protein
VALGEFRLNFVEIRSHIVADLHHQCHRPLVSFTILLADAPDAVANISLEGHLRRRKINLNSLPSAEKRFMLELTYRKGKSH